MSKHNSHHNPFASFIRFVATLIVLALAVKKLLEWLHKHQNGLQQNDVVSDFVRLASQTINKAKTDLAPMAEKFESSLPESVKAEIKRVASKPVVKKAVAKAVKAAKPIKVEKTITPLNLNKRQEKVYQMLRARGQVTVQAIAKEFSDVSSRTLRRDMTQLEELGLVTQSGKTKNSVYKLK